MKSKIMMLVCLTMFVLLLQGCQLARSDMGTYIYDDKMIGVFITTEHLDLFDFEGYMNENSRHISSGEVKIDKDTEKYQGRLYADLRTLTNEETGEPSDTLEYVFEGIEGIAYFVAVTPSISVNEEDAYISTISGDAMSDAHTAIAYKDDRKTTTLEGTIYVTDSARNQVFYMNPIYQSADGKVYLTNGAGMSSDMGSEGRQMSYDMESTTTVMENGKRMEESLSVTVNIDTISSPRKIVILKMDADNKLLSQTVYNSGEMPFTLSPGTGTEYIIVEKHKQGEESLPIREVYSRDAEAMEYFTAGDDGICVKHTILLDW